MSTPSEADRSPIEPPVEPLVDEGSEFGARAARHLREDPVVWLTTVGPSGAPSPNPVWFRWDGARTVWVHNLPTAARVAHVATNPRVTLNFGGNGKGGDIVVLVGLATARPDGPRADADPDFVAKYAELIPQIGHTPASFGATYSVPVEITVSRLRGH
jgi:PPOX class probable F420-dependent enzyme